MNKLLKVTYMYRIAIKILTPDKNGFIMQISVNDNMF